ncbi:MAG: amino acid ABC transporter permease [Bacillaceae bacterium]
MDFQFSIIQEYLPYFGKGVIATLQITVISIFIGTILGLLIGIGKLVKNPFVSFPFVMYINFFRGTPVLVQLFLIHFGLMPFVFGVTTPFWSGVATLSLNAAAYIAEIFRAGIQSIDKGQTEAARSLGMTNMQAMRYIIIPQAFKRMIPALGNEFIVLLKETSLIAVIAGQELTYWGRAAVAQYYRVWEPYLTIALIYLLLTLTLSLLLKWLEKRLDNDYSRKSKKVLRKTGSTKEHIAKN